jgi:hypothetical protein
MKRAAASLVVALVSFASPAVGLDLCYVESTTGHSYEFHKVKLPKRAGDAVPLAGVLDGTLGVFGTIHTVGNDLALSGVANGCFVTGTFGATLDASVTFNCAPIGGGVSAYTWSRFACGSNL